MRRAAALLIAASLAAVLAPAVALAQGGATAAIDRGRQIALRNCSLCHATGETGDSPNAMAPRFRELARRYPMDNLQEALAEGILTGHPAMPEFRFAPNQISDLIAYLKSIQKRTEAPDEQRGEPNRPLTPR